MNTYRGVEVWFHAFLTSALYAGERLASRPGRASLPGKDPRLDRRLGGPPSRSGRGGEGKISHHCSCRELNPGHPARSLVTIPTELPRLLIISRKMGWDEHVARMDGWEMRTKFLMKNLIDISWRNKVWLDADDLEESQVVSYCGRGNEPSVFRRGGEFRDQLSDYQLLKSFFCFMKLV
jgi:hypothetical protein